MRCTVKLSAAVAVGALALAGTANAQPSIGGGINVGGGGFSVTPPSVSLPQAGPFLPGATQFLPNVRGTWANRELNNALDYTKDRYIGVRPSSPSTLMPVPDGPSTVPNLSDRSVGRPIGGGTGMADGTPLGQRAPVEQDIQFDEGVQTRPRRTATLPSQPAPNPNQAGWDLAAGIVDLVGAGIQEAQRQQYDQTPHYQTPPQPAYQQQVYQQPQRYLHPAYQHQPVYQQPAYQQPQGYQQPVYQQQVYQQPAYQQQVYQQPAYQQQVYQQPPAYQQPVYQQPIYRQSQGYIR